MIRQQWYISDSRMVNCALGFDDLERAIGWKKYMERIRPEFAPHIIHGVLLDEKNELIVNYKKEQES